MPFNPYQTNEDYFDWKASTGTGGGGTPGTTQPGPGGGTGSFGLGGFYGSGPSYDPTAPSFGYRRRLLAGSPLSAPGPGLPTMTALSGMAPRQATAYSGIAPGGSGEGGISTQAPSYASPSLSLFNTQGILNAGGGGSSTTGPATWTAGGRQYQTPNFDPNDPFGRLYGAWDGNVNQLLNYLINSGQLSGAFDPTGAGLMDQIAGQFNRNAANTQAGLRLGLQSNNTNNPNAFGLASLMGDLGNARDISQAQSNAQLQATFRNQDYYRNLVDQLLSYQRQRDLGQQGYDFQSAINSANKPSFWDQLAGVGGQVAGGWLSPGGWFSGAGH